MFALLPRLVERTGQGEFGSITAVYAVLVTGSGTMSTTSLPKKCATLDGHIELSRSLAERGHYPAIDVLRSLSRVMDEICDATQRGAAAKLRELLSLSERQRDLVLLGRTSAAAIQPPTKRFRNCQRLRNFAPGSLRAQRLG